MRAGVTERTLKAACGCLSPDPLICLEERHRRWPRESADYFEGDGCRCGCHGEQLRNDERGSPGQEARP